MHEDNRDEQRDHGGQLLTLVFAVLFLVFLSPGAVLVYVACRVVSLHADPLELWLFSLLGSVSIFTALVIQARSAARGSVRYLVLAVTVSLVGAISYWGFDARWPLEMWSAFAGR
jgi:hypothetical protein